MILTQVFAEVRDDDGNNPICFTWNATDPLASLERLINWLSEAAEKKKNESTVAKDLQ